MLFPVSGVEVNPFVPFIVAFVVSFFTSMGGVSGAFLLLPFQVSVLNYTAPSVSATNQVFNIVAIPSGVYRYIREGRMLWPLTKAVIIGTLPGVFIGAWIRIEYLPDPKNFKMFVALVLLYVGVRLLKDILTSKRPKETVSSSKIRVTEFNLRRVAYDFDGRTHCAGTPALAGLSFVVGIVGGIYGIGGGAIMAPFLVSIFRLPVHTVAGATLMGTFVTSVAGVAFYQGMAPFYPDLAVAPNYSLGLLFGAGGFVGMYLGARFQKFVPATAIKWMLVGCILFTALKYIADFVRIACHEAGC